MGELKKTRKLQGDYGELIFEHYCIKNRYAFIKLEEIFNTLTPKNVLIFKFGFDRIPVKLPEDIVEEVRKICQPSNKKEHEPSFVYDYLTVSLHKSFEYIDEKWVHNKHLSRKAFNWVEIKTGKSQLSPNQKRTKMKITLPLCVFRISTEIPEKFDVDWYTE